MSLSGSSKSSSSKVSGNVIEWYGALDSSGGKSTAVERNACFTWSKASLQSSKRTRAQYEHQNKSHIQLQSQSSSDLYCIPPQTPSSNTKVRVLQNAANTRTTPLPAEIELHPLQMNFNTLVYADTKREIGGRYGEDEQ
nr:hypothetical protein Iba_chr01cCG12310 [Ipomoea batatas]